MYLWENSSMNNTPQPCLPTLNFHWCQSSCCHLSLFEFDGSINPSQMFWDLSRTGMAQMVPHTRSRFDSDQFLYVQCTYEYKYVDQNSSAAMQEVNRCYTIDESKKSTACMGSPLELKPIEDVFKSPQQEYQWLHKDLKPLQLYKRPVSRK